MKYITLEENKTGMLKNTRIGNNACTCRLVSGFETIDLGMVAHNTNPDQTAEEHLILPLLFGKAILLVHVL